MYYKVNFSGFAIVEAGSEEEAKEKFPDEFVYEDKWITSIETDFEIQDRSE